jgi:hypothetical protein
MKKRIILLNLPAEKMLEKDVKGYNTDPDNTFVYVPIDSNHFNCFQGGMFSDSAIDGGGGIPSWIKGCGITVDYGNGKDDSGGIWDSCSPCVRGDRDWGCGCRPDIPSPFFNI